MKNVFEVRNLAFKYPKANEDTIKSISFEVEEGKIFGLLAPAERANPPLKNPYQAAWGIQGEIRYNGKDLATARNFMKKSAWALKCPSILTSLRRGENLAYFASLYKNNADYSALLEKSDWEMPKNRGRQSLRE